MEVSQVILAPPERVWQVITDTSLWPSWGPSVAEVTCKERYICLGTRGAVKIAHSGIWVNFEITQFEPGKHWSWKVMGIPATTHRVEPVWDEDASQIIGTTLVFGLPTLAAPYALVCKRALTKIADLLANESQGL